MLGHCPQREGVKVPILNVSWPLIGHNCSWVASYRPVIGWIKIQPPAVTFNTGILNPPFLVFFCNYDVSSKIGIRLTITPNRHVPQAITFLFFIAFDSISDWFRTMSLKKMKGRRIKLSNRNKIEYLHNKIKKMKIEKKTLAERLKDTMKDTAATVELFEYKLKSEENKVHDLKKTVECPVCLEVPRKGPVFTCPNGHLVCQKCKRASCPTCREAMGGNNSLVAVAIIEKILHDCKFIDCAQKFSLNNIEEHEKVCMHRAVACPNSQCAQRMPLSKLLDHLETSPRCCTNRKPLYVDGSSIAINYHLSSRELRYLRRVALPVWVLCFEGRFFALNVNKSGDYWRFFMVMFESSEVCSDFSVEMDVYETNSPPDTRQSMKARCHPCPIDQTIPEMEGYCYGLVVHHKFMKTMFKEDSFKLTVSISFLISS